MNFLELKTYIIQNKNNLEIIGIIIGIIATVIACIKFAYSLIRKLWRRKSMAFKITFYFKNPSNYAGFSIKKFNDDKMLDFNANDFYCLDEQTQNSSTFKKIWSCLMSKKLSIHERATNNWIHINLEDIELFYLKAVIKSINCTVGFSNSK